MRDIIVSPDDDSPPSETYCPGLVDNDAPDLDNAKNVSKVREIKVI
jgi:hypothetical protein